MTIVSPVSMSPQTSERDHTTLDQDEATKASSLQPCRVPFKKRLCDICESSPVSLRRPSTSEMVCKACFYSAFEEEIHNVITSTKMFEKNDTVAIGVSGGKDSTVLAHVMTKLNREKEYGLNLLLLAIDEGIKGYRDDSLATVVRNSDQYKLPLTVLSYVDLYNGWSMDKVVQQIGLQNNCTFCGVFRRQALEKGCMRLGVTKLLTGHNADDCAETVLMNLLRGDLNRLCPNGCEDSRHGIHREDKQPMEDNKTPMVDQERIDEVGMRVGKDGGKLSSDCDCTSSGSAQKGGGCMMSRHHQMGPQLALAKEQCSISPSPSDSLRPLAVAPDRPLSVTCPIPVSRLKPLRYTFEKEIVLYAHFLKLDYFCTECTYSPNAYRGRARDFLKELERVSPQYILSILHSGDRFRKKQGGNPKVDSRMSSEGMNSNPAGRIQRVDLKQIANGRQSKERATQQEKPNSEFACASGKSSHKPQSQNRSTERRMKACSRCGMLSSNSICKACVLIEGLDKKRHDLAISNEKKQRLLFRLEYEKGSEAS